MWILLTPKQQYTAEMNMTPVRMMKHVMKKPIIRLELQKGNTLLFTGLVNIELINYG